MYFPRLTAEAAEAEFDNEDIATGGEAGETILLVEDDSSVRTYLAEILRGLNYGVIIASNAQGALTVLLQDEKRVDLLLTDIIMPGLNGRELGRRAQALRPGLNVLYMTGYSRNAVMHHGRLDEGVELLQKPVSQGQLATRIRAMLDRAQERAATAPSARGRNTRDRDTCPAPAACRPRCRACRRAAATRCGSLRGRSARRWQSPSGRRRA